MKFRDILMAVGLGIGFTFTLLGALGVGVISSAQAAPLALPANQAPIVGVSSVLYDGSLNIRVVAEQG